jgi:hypothetical protein
MISLVDIDDVFQARLKLIKFGSTSVKIYPYIPDREKLGTEYPCVAFQRLSHSVINAYRRPGQSVFIPSEESQDTEITDRLIGLGIITGPVMYTRKPYPTPVAVIYEVHTLATKKSHADYLTTAMLSAIPTDYCPWLDDGQQPQFVHDKPINLDDLTKPEFRTSYLYEVTPVWIDRLEAWATAPITAPSLVFETIDSE